MQPPLLFPAALVRTKNGFDGKGLPTRDGIRIDNQTIAVTAEEHCSACGRVDYLRLSEHRWRVATDALEIIDLPGFRTLSLNGRFGGTIFSCWFV